MSLPKGFKRLEYIESTGTQYVDTQVFAVSGYTATVDFQATYVPASGQSFILAEYDKSGSWRSGLYNGSFYTSGGFTYSQTSSTTARTIATGTCAAIIPYPMYLFAQSEGGSAAHLANSKYKLFSCQIWDDNGTLVRDYIPCQNASGAVGLWDAVNEEFYGNAGTGTFTAGPVVPEIVDESEITELEYIQSSGTQYLDTLFNPNNNTRIVFDFRSTFSTVNSPKGFFGSRNSSDVGMFAFLYSNRIDPNYNGVGKSVTVDPLQRHVYDFNKNIFSIDGSSVSFDSGTFSPGYNLLLLSVQNYGDVDARMAEGYLYSCQIYDNGLLERDYVPAMMSNGEVGLYDRVFHGFYRNAGTGEFIAGPEAATVPKAPANFRVVSETDTLVTLTWDEGDDAMGYRLYRQGQLLADITETSVSVEVEPFAGAVFTLTAYNENGEGAETSLTHFSIPDNPLLYLITDRTAQDVAERNPKGYYAASDLNRVGYAMDYLANIIRGYGYTLEVHTKTDWTDEDWKLTGEMVQYLQSLNNLKSVFSTLLELPETMEKIGYQDANNIEQLLLTIDETVARVVAGFTRANAFGLRSGAKGLPASQSDRGRNWGQLDAMGTTWANWQLATWYLLLYGNLKAEGVVE